MTKIILNVLKQTSGVFSIATLIIANSALANQISVEQLANAQDVNTKTTTTTPNYPTTLSELPKESQADTPSEEVEIPGDTRLQNLKDPSLKIPGA
ncbi:MAG: hypothetical protein F6K17_24835, partial [Okeania sp. SIO3C4]|nr:hypothetical protein [Okeania sp. SIO3C4]